MMASIVVMQVDAEFRGRNWPEYDESLIKRGEMYLTFPFSGVRHKNLGIKRGMIEPSRTKQNLSK